MICYYVLVSPVVPSLRLHFLVFSHEIHSKCFDRNEIISKRLVCGCCVDTIRPEPDNTYIRTCIHTYMHTCIHTYIHTYIQTNKQTNTQARYQLLIQQACSKGNDENTESSIRKHIRAQRIAPLVEPAREKEELAV